MAFDFWKASSSRRKRILTIGMFFFLSLIITLAGSLTPLSSSDANSINQELEKMRQNIGVQYIFGNNMMLCLIMFVPIAGPVFGMLVLYNTGVAISAEGATSHISAPLLLLLLFIFPFTWLEFISYSIAFGASVWLTWRLIKHRVRSELSRTCIFIAICAVLLLVAAIIEMAVIEAMPAG